MVASFNTVTSPLASNPNPYPDSAVESPFAPAQLAAAGSNTQATASSVTAEITVITNNTTTNGVILPVPSFSGQKHFLYPALASDALTVYPPVGGSINSGGTNTALDITARKIALFIALDTTGNYIAGQMA